MTISTSHIQPVNGNARTISRLLERRVADESRLAMYRARVGLVAAREAAVASVLGAPT